MNDTKRPRGRPRPQETIDRDDKILEYLRAHGARTRNDLAEILGEEKSKVWLALDRLRRAGLARICTSAVGGADMLWTAEVDQPCP